MSAITVVSPVTLVQSIRTNYANYCHPSTIVYMPVLQSLSSAEICAVFGKAAVDAEEDNLFVVLR